MSRFDAPLPRALALAVLAAIPVLPALAPAAATYLDNPSHLVEVKELVDILAEDRWFSGWGLRANAGMAVNQVNAPLVWAVVAALAPLGVVAVYLLGIVASNILFALGAHRLFTRFLGPDAGWLAAALAALAPQDLYGFAGAAGGMWPHRLANGLLLWGLGAPGPSSPGRIGVWLAAVLLCHTYAGMDAAGIVGIAIVLDLAGRRWRDAGRRTLGAAIGAAISAPFWVPLLTPGVRPDFAGWIRFWNLGDHLAELLLPFNPVQLNNPLEWEFIGGPLNFAWAALLVSGLGGAFAGRAALQQQLGPFLRPPLVAAPIFLALLLVIVMAIVPFTLTEAFGPNPWRHLAVVRAALCGIAGFGLVHLGYGVRSALTPLLGAVALVGAWAGVLEMRLPTGEASARHHADLRAVWSDLVAASPKGRVYHQNTSFRESAPPPLRHSEIGALIAFQTDLPVVGTWYSISAVASEPHMRSANLGLFGDSPDRWYRAPDDFFARARAFDLGAVVSVEPRLAAFLAKRPEARLVSERGAFAAFLLEGAGLPAIECPPGVTCLYGPETRGAAALRFSGAIPATALGVRQTWHPWWVATINGEPARILREKRSGRLNVALPALPAGEHVLNIRWTDPTRWTIWPALLGLVLAAATWVRRVTG
jgi:hypothetical protein